MPWQIGIDACFLIDLFNGDKNAISFFNKYADQFVIQEQVIFEFLCGNITKNQRIAFLNKIQLIPSVPFNRESTIIASKIYRHLKEKGRTINTEDILIASTYISNGVNSIVTRNEKHYKNLKIKIEKY